VCDVKNDQIGLSESDKNQTPTRTSSVKNPTPAPSPPRKPYSLPLDSATLLPGAALRIKRVKCR